MSQKPCPERNQVSAYLLGRLDEAASEVLDAHFLQCKDCQTLLARTHPEEDTFVSELKSGFSQSEFEEEPALRNVIQRISNHDFRKKNVASSLNAPIAWDEPDTIFEPPQALSLGPYRLQKVLGKGGMGQVYLAEHVRLEMIVAVKVLADQLTHNPQAIARFDREMKAVGRLNHPNIVRATDAGEFQGQHYLVMEFVDGRDLSQIVSANGTLRINDACETISQAAAGIQHAHDYNLIHRDLKPSNLMITKEGLVKVLDLGLARLQTKSGEGLTSDFQIMGTADYMAPEQALKALEVDSRVDIYSLGCTLYALLCGQPPFADAKYSSSLRKIMAHEQEQPMKVHERRAEIPVALSEIVDKAMAKLPAERFASVGDFATALQPFVEGADLASLYKSASIGSAQAAKNTSDIAKHLAMTDTVTTAKPKPMPGATPPSRSSRTWWIAIALMLFAGAGVASLILRFNSANGTIIVEIEGDQIQTSLDGERIVVEDKNKGTIYHLSISGEQTQTPLSPGNYAIRVENEASGLKLDTHEFQITRNNATVVKAYLQQTAMAAPAVSVSPNLPNSIPPTAESAAKSFAEWALTKKAILKVESNGNSQFVENVNSLPSGAFQVTSSNFTKPFYLEDEDFERIGTVTSLKHLEFQDLDLTDRVVSGLTALPEIRILRLRYDESKPRQLSQLNRLPQLTDLTVGGALVGDEEVAMLSKLKFIPRLTVSGAEVTDAALQHLGEMEQLTFLSLNFTKVNGSGLFHLQKLKKLQSLHLPYTPTNDAGTEAIAVLPTLTWLNLSHTKISDRCLDNLIDLKKLEILELIDGFITGDGVEKLHKMDSLRKLDLKGTQITDADVDRLASLSQLTTLVIWDRLSSAAVARLQEKLPDCEIILASNLPLKPAPHDYDRQVAEAMIERGAKVHVKIGSGYQSAVATDKLPLEKFRISRVEFLSSYELTDEDFESLVNLKELAALDLCDVIISERVINYLIRIKSLSLLWLKYDEGPVTGLERLVRLPTPYNLKLQGSAVGDAEVKAMSQLVRVRFLCLHGKGFTDECIPDVVKISEIAELSIENSRVTGSGFKHLADLPRLETLQVPGSLVGDAHLEDLVGIKRLKMLNLTNSRITDKAVDVLQTLTQLKHLIVDSRLTKDAVENLRSKIPECNVVGGR